MSGSRCSPHTSLTIAAPAVERPGRDGGLHGVDRDRNAERDHGRQDGGKARAFLIERHRDRIAIGPRGFRADIEDVGAFGGKALRLGNGGCRIEKAAAVGKRVRGDIEDAHDQRTSFLKEVA